MLAYLKRKVRNYLLKHLFCALTEEDAITVVQRGKSVTIKVNGRVVPSEQVSAFAQEARLIQHSHLWKQLKQSLTEDAYKIMFVNAKTTDDLFFGKAMLYNVDILDKKLSQLADIET